jgi:hypothetical protein
MATIINCPDCDRSLKVPDELLGKKVKCPGCGVTFTAAGKRAAPEPPPARRSARDDEGIEEEPRGRKPAIRDDDEEDERRVRRRRPDDDEDEAPRGRRRDEEEEEDEDYSRGGGERTGWMRVRTGLLILLIAQALWGGAILVGILSGMIAAASTPSVTANPQGGVTVSSGGFGFANVVGWCGNILQFASVITTFVGYGFFIATAARTGARGFAIAALALGVGFYLVLVIGIFAVFATLFASFGSSNPLTGLGAATSGALALMAVLIIMKLAENICHHLYLRKIMSYLRARSLATAISYLLGLYISVPVCALIFLLLIFGGVAVASSSTTTQGASSGGGMAFMGLGCICVDILLWLGWYVWYVITLFQVRGVVDGTIRRS